MLNDTMRCHDDKCTVREQCERWMRRADEGHIVHAMTLKVAYIPHHCPCSRYVGEPIEVEE